MAKTFTPTEKAALKAMNFAPGATKDAANNKIA